MKNQRRSWQFRVFQLVAAPLLATGCAAGDEEVGASVVDDHEGEDVALRALDESEPNDAPDQAGVRTMTLGDDNRGGLSQSDPFDHWRLEIKARTYVNLFLGEIPGGSQYDLHLIKDGEILWSGTKQGDTQIVTWFDLEAGVYTLQVHAADSPAPGKYLLRAAVTAVSEGLKWVYAEMPYCQAANDEYDAACEAVCEREPHQERPEWDDYRSDCSGFVSYAWGLGPPGLGTGLLSSRFSPVGVADLQPGDILLHITDPSAPGHVVLFEKWLDKASGALQVLEEYSCGYPARRVSEVVSKVSNDPNTILRGVSYTARRFDMP